MAGLMSNYTDNGATDPDQNGRRLSSGQDLSYMKPYTEQEQARLSAMSGNNQPINTDFFGIGANKDATAAAQAHLNSFYGGVTPQTVPVKPAAPAGPLPQASYSNEGRARPPIVFNDVAPSAKAVTQQGLQMPAQGSGFDYTSFEKSNPENARNEWQAMARQLANFSMLRQMTPQGFVGVLPDHNAEDNAEKTARWARDDMMGRIDAANRNARTGVQKQGVATMAHLAGQLYGTDASLQKAGLDADTARRGQDLHLQGIGLQGEIQGQNQRENTRMVGENQLAVTGLQGQNQMGVTGLQGLNQLALAKAQGENQLAGIDAQGQNQQNLELMREHGPLATAQADLARSGVGLNQAQTELAHANAVNAIPKMDPHVASIGKLLEVGALDTRDPAHKRLIDQYIKTLDSHISGGVGQSAPPSQAVAALKANPKLQADFDAKYGHGAAARALGGGV